MIRILRLLGYVFALPHTLVLGLPLALLYRCSEFRWSNGCLEAIAGRKPNKQTRIFGRPGAQTHGWFIVYASLRHRNDDPLRVHERVHVVQAFIGGPLYPLAYALCFLAFLPFVGRDDKTPRWKRAYYRIPFERQAYRIQAEFSAGKRPGAWGSERGFIPHTGGPTR